MTRLNGISRSASEAANGFSVERCTDAAEWDAFVALVPWATPQHRFGYGETLDACFGYLRTRYLLFSSGSTAVAALPLVRLATVTPFRAVYSSVFDAYGGPLIHPAHEDDDALQRMISETIDREATSFGAFEMRCAIPSGAPAYVERLVRRGESDLVMRRSCPTLDLDRPWTEIVDGYRASVRRAIRRSERAGIVVEGPLATSEVREAYPIYRATMSRLGGTAKPWRFIAGLLDAQIAVAFRARHEGQTVGIVVLVASSSMAKYWISAVDPAASGHRPTNALVNHAVRWCHDRGIPQLCFGESHGERPGLVRFKLSWGSTLEASSVIARIYRPLVQRAWGRALEPVARRTYAVWDQLRTLAG